MLVVYIKSDFSLPHFSAAEWIGIEIAWEINLKNAQFMLVSTM